MKVLFVYRSYGDSKKKPIVETQARAIQRHTKTDLIRCPVSRGGIGYIHGILQIRKMVNEHEIDIIHAHYSLCGYIAILALTGKPVVVSLMGSDLWDKTMSSLFIPFFHRYLWTKTIVKSKEMHAVVWGAEVIPNGIDLDHFKPSDKKYAKSLLGFDDQAQHIIFVSTSINMPVKNVKLAQKAIQLLLQKTKNNVVFHLVSNVEYASMPFYYNAADVLLLTSIKEGSPNVVKEALACNCKVVSTDVGDVRERIDPLSGCYVSSGDPRDLAEKLELALNATSDLNLRKSVQELDNKIIADRIYTEYKKIFTD